MGSTDQPRDYHGRFTHDLVDSLQARLEAKGHDAAKARGLAVEILTEQGSLDSRGNLTAHGRERQTLGREGRAKDRLATQTGHKPEHLTYDRRTGKAYVK